MRHDGLGNRSRGGSNRPAVFLQPLCPSPLFPLDTHWPSAPTLLMSLSTHLRIVESGGGRNGNKEMGQMGRCSWFKLCCPSFSQMRASSPPPPGLRVMLGCVEAERGCIHSNPGSATYLLCDSGHVAQRLCVSTSSSIQWGPLSFCC